MCVSLMAYDTKELIKKIKEAEKIADLIEVRLDYMNSFDLEEIIKASKIPVLMTYRRPEEGGFRKDLKDEERALVLNKAIELGVDYIDVELDMDPTIRDELIKRRKNTKVVVSKHFFSHVEQKTLYRCAEELFSIGADIGKIIGYAKNWSDNLMYLNLVSDLFSEGYKIISFAMGPYGVLSRVISPIFGAEWTYGSLKREERTASGQIQASLIKKIWKEIECGERCQ